jgi:hypothetical protein
MGISQIGIIVIDVRDENDEPENYTPTNVMLKMSIFILVHSGSFWFILVHSGSFWFRYDSCIF